MIMRLIPTQMKAYIIHILANQFLHESIAKDALEAVYSSKNTGMIFSGMGELVLAYGCLMSYENIELIFLLNWTCGVLFSILWSVTLN